MDPSLSDDVRVDEFRPGASDSLLVAGSPAGAGATGGYKNVAGTSKDRHYEGENAQLRDPFYNDYDATQPIKHENIKHRLMIMMALNCSTNKEIADATGYSPGYVSQVLRQPWARARMQEFMRVEGENLRELIQREGLRSFRNVVDIANNELVKPEVRLNANKEIIDRFLGKAVQPVTTVAAKPAELTDEELDLQIEERKRQLTSRGN